MSKTRPLTVQLDPKVVSEVVKKQIEALEKEVRLLKARVARDEVTILKHKEGMKLTKAQRAKVRDICETFIDLLIDENWVDYDRFFDGC